MTDNRATTTSSVAYLDYNASAPVRASVIDAVADALSCVGNPSSVHRAGRVALRTIEDARTAVGELVGATTGEVVFTSGGTEANNLAITGGCRGHLYVSAVEHPSMLEVSVPGGVTKIPVDGDGRTDVDAFRELSQGVVEGSMVSVMLANNETGVIQPVEEIAEIAHARGISVHCDGVQAAGKIPIHMEALGVDLMTLSAHKIGGPMGVGALVSKRNFHLSPLLKGGGQEKGKRAGTENVPGIAGFGIAAREALVEALNNSNLKTLRDRVERGLCQQVAGAVVFGSDTDRLANTTCIALPGVDADVQVMALDLAGVLVSSGSACSSGKVGPSHVLAAMGVAPELARTAIRISLGRETTEQDIDRLTEAWTGLVHPASSQNLDRGVAAS
jgi:cysteine desulfurase